MIRTVWQMPTRHSRTSGSKSYQRDFKPSKRRFEGFLFIPLPVLRLSAIRSSDHFLQIPVTSGVENNPIYCLCLHSDIRRKLAGENLISVIPVLKRQPYQNMSLQMNRIYYAKRILLAVILAIISLESSLAQDSLKLDIQKGAINFIVFGDWGRFGDDHQIPVAQQMARTAREVEVTFFVNLGDNFYPKGVASPTDPHWHYSLEEIYKDFALQREWYSVLGNHDYLGNPDAQVAYTKISRRWQMPARYYNKSIGLRDGSGKRMKFTFIDTNPLIPEFYQNQEYGPNVKSQDSTAQKAWIKESISVLEPNVQWNLVVGHHPMFTGSLSRREGYDTKRIRNSLNQLLNTHMVDAYLAGHDHSLQHLQPGGKGVHHFVSGSASEATQVDKLDYSKFAARAYGFLLFSVTAKELVVHAIDYQGKILYRTSITK